MPQEYKHEQPRVNAFNYRGLLLYILPAPLIIKFIISIIALSPMKMLFSGVALFFFYSAAHLTRVTLTRLAESQIHPKPHKIRDYRKLSLIYVGIGTLLLMLLIRRAPLSMVIMPLCSMVGYYLLYGMSAVDTSQSVDFDAMPSATREAIRDAYSDLEHVEALSVKINDKELTGQIDNVVTQSYKILGLLSRSPNDAGRARRFLNVYIHRIKEILTQYVNLSEYGKSEEFRERLSNVLSETYQAFSKQESKLLDDDQFKLDVQLEVLDEQIKNENK